MKLFIDNVNARLGPDRDQKELARTGSLDPSTISKVLGRKRPNPEVLTLAKFAVALGVRLEDLFLPVAQPSQQPALMAASEEEGADRSSVIETLNRVEADLQRLRQQVERMGRDV
jgi:transcriptional regulator with XRE-family HTH domain